MPSTAIGRWAGCSSLCFIVLFIVAAVPALAFRVPGFGLLGIVSAVLSIFALTKGHDRSWLVWLGIAVAAVLLADLLKALLLGA